MDATVGGNAVTRFVIPDDVGPDEAFRTVTDVWKGYHSADPPAWVESDSDELARRLGGYWNATVGRPDGWTGVGDYMTLAEPDAAPPQTATPVEQATPTEGTA
jgi:hypothetical protein